MTTAVETPPAQTEIQNPKSKTALSSTWLLLAITLLGGGLRFAFLDRPPIWGDEAMTFMRICGTYQQMLDVLQDWGFAPLHYELYWWLAQHFTMTPFMMRLVPAIAGTAIIPAMYWLAWELVRDRRVALVTALFTATSAYLLVYSRDAKMYMHFWLFCALNFAALLWWLRVRTRLAWWTWVATGTVMLGLNMLGLIVLSIEIIAVAVAPHAHWRWLGHLFLLFIWMPVKAASRALQWLGAAPRGARPFWDRWFNRTLANFRWPIFVFFLLGVAIMLLGPAGYYLHFNRYVDRLERAGLAGGGLNWVEGYNRGRSAADLLLYTTTAHLYSWEWPRFNQKLKIDDAKEIHPRALFWLKLSGMAILTLLALSLLPWPRDWRGRRARELSPFAMIVLAAWIVLPAYGFYCASTASFFSPIEALATIPLKEVKRVDWPTFQSISEGTLWADWSRASIQVTEMLRKDNLRWPENWWQWSILVGAVGVVIAGFLLSAPTMRQRMYKLSVLLAIVGTLFILCMLIYAFYTQRYKGSVWMPRYLGVIWPALIIAVALLLMRLPTRPLRWGAVAILVAVNLANFGARVFAGSEPPAHIMAQDLIDSQPKDAAVRMYWAVGVERSGAPGTGYLFSVPGAYYLTILSGRGTNPSEMLSAFFPRGRFERKWQIWSTGLLRGWGWIATEARKTPELKRIIIWDNVRPNQSFPDDELLHRLGNEWRLVDERVHYVRDHWTWRNLMTVRRRVYERSPAAPA